MLLMVAQYEQERHGRYLQDSPSQKLASMAFIAKDQAHLLEGESTMQLESADPGQSHAPPGRIKGSFRGLS